MRNRRHRVARFRVLELESRLAPSVTAALSGNAVSFLGDAGNDHLVLTTDAAGYVRHNLAGQGGLASVTDLDAATPGVQERLFNALTGFSVNLGAGTDT